DAGAYWSTLLHRASTASRFPQERQPLGLKSIVCVPAATRSPAFRSVDRTAGTCIGIPHFLATQSLRTKGIKPQFPNGIVSSVSFVSTTNTARSLAGFVLLPLALTPWRSPGSSEKFCPAL